MTSWFLTHCGFNGVVESISAGVPMICWPFGAEQPVNALHITHNLDVAYELFEVRSGHGLKPLHRTAAAPIATEESLRAEANEVLERAFGEDGARKRANVAKLSAAFKEMWSEQGPSRLALVRFLEAV